MSCPVCKRNSLEEKFFFGKLPTYNLCYYKDYESAINSKLKSVCFVQCRDCQFVFNKLRLPLSYEIDYISTRSYSKYFRDYLLDVVSFVQDNVEPSNIINILEIGGGDGEFLNALRKVLSGNCFIYDPSYKASSSPLFPDIVIENKSYGLEKKEGNSLNPDLIILRHVLESIIDVDSFIKNIAYESPQYIFIEIPCYEFVQQGFYHLFSYERVSYFSVENLELLLKNNGYALTAMEYVFNGEYIIALFQNIETLPDRYSPVRKSYLGQSNMINFEDFKKNILKQIDSETLLWGMAGKGVALVNLLGLSRKEMPYVVDINPELQGKFNAGTGNKIILPQDICDKRFKKILVTNELYLIEVKKIADSLELKCNVEALRYC